MTGRDKFKAEKIFAILNRVRFYECEKRYLVYESVFRKCVFLNNIIQLPQETMIKKSTDIITTMTWKYHRPLGGEF
jgi:hypothetical protein